jgi:hypothetical protein
MEQEFIELNYYVLFKGSTETKNASMQRAANSSACTSAGNQRKTRAMSI